MGRSLEPRTTRMWVMLRMREAARGEAAGGGVLQEGRGERWPARVAVELRYPLRVWYILLMN